MANTTILISARIRWAFILDTGNLFIKQFKYLKLFLSRERGHNLCLSEKINLSSVFEFTRLEEFHPGKRSPKPTYIEGFAQFQVFASLVQFCIYNLSSLAMEAAPTVPVHWELRFYHFGWDMVQTNLTYIKQPTSGMRSSINEKQLLIILQVLQVSDTLCTDAWSYPKLLSMLKFSQRPQMWQYYCYSNDCFEKFEGCSWLLPWNHKAD